ncbi:MAG: ABC transporter ATP-binding protein [Terracidiphilus sp.]
MNATNEKAAPAIQCEYVCKTYRSLWRARAQWVRALRFVSLVIEPGQIVGLIGPNGAGKTTLLTLIAGLIRPTEGRISVCGHPARSLAAHRSLGYMPETPALMPSHSPRATLRYHAALCGMSSRQCHAETDRLLDQLDLREVADRKCGRFSLGMRQRLSLGIALTNSPKVLLLDEPSNGMDPVGIIKLRELLKGVRDSGATILISSHRLGELEQLTSRFIYLYKGEIAHFDSRNVPTTAGRVRIGFSPGGQAAARRALASRVLIESDGAELIVTVSSPDEVPEIVRELVKEGVSITSVTPQGESLEEIFMRLYNGGK